MRTRESRVWNGEPSINRKGAGGGREETTELNSFVLAFQKFGDREMAEGRKQDRTNFELACSLLSQYIKEKGSVADLGLGVAQDAAKGEVFWSCIWDSWPDFCIGWYRSFLLFLPMFVGILGEISCRNAIGRRFLLIPFQKFVFSDYSGEYLFG